MRLLFDTHSFLWFVDGDPRLSARARQLLEDQGNTLFISISSLWELAIKYSLGKMQLPQPFEILIPQLLADIEIEVLGISLDHLAAVSKLPMHHRDPFDRLIIVQSLVEQIPLVSVDEAFDAYGIERLW